jgi:hypothetical protein
MKKLAISICGIAAILALPSAWSQFNLSSLGGSAYQMLGGSQSVSSIASSLVSSSLKDPRLASLAQGKKVDPAATSGKMSDQLCAMLGGDCKAPLTDSQVASAASKVTPAQSKAIWAHFNSALGKVASDPLVREAVTKALGDKLPGVVAGLL